MAKKTETADNKTYVALCPTCGNLIAARCAGGTHSSAADIAHDLSEWAKGGFAIESSTTDAMRQSSWCSCPRKERTEIAGLKLWKATVEIDIYVASENQPSDWEFADAAADEIRDNQQGADVYAAAEVCELSEVAEVWRDSLPRGSENRDDLTCQQIVESVQARRAEAVRNAAMPNQMNLPIEDAK